MNKETIIKIIGEFFQPLVDTIDDPIEEQILFAELGFITPDDITIFENIGNLFDELAELIVDIEDLYLNPEEANYVDLLFTTVLCVKDIILNLSNLSSLISNASANAGVVADTDLLQVLPQRLFDYLLINMLEKTYPSMYTTLLLLGIVDEVLIEQTDLPHRVSYLQSSLRWDRIPSLIEDLPNLLKAVYGWADDELKIEELLARLYMLGMNLGIDVEIDAVDDRVKEAFATVLGEGSASIDDGDETSILRIPLTRLQPSPIALEIYPISNSAGFTDGCGIVLDSDPEMALSIQVSDCLKLEFSFASAAAQNLGVCFRRGNPLAFMSNVFQSDPVADLSSTNLQAKAAMMYQDPTSPTVLLGSSQSTRLQVQSTQFALGFEKPANSAAVFFGEVELLDGALVIQAGDGDGFIQKLLPQNPMSITFELLIGYSGEKGLYVKGGAGLEYTFQVNKTIGPFFISTIDLELYVDGDGLSLITAISGGAVIGPVAASVSKIGLKTDIVFGQQGLLGNADLEFGFKPPNGFGALIDASVVKGGGYVEADPPEYAGILTLAIAEIVDVTAIALVTTKIDGHDAFSMILLISARFQPIQLSFGFALTGVGGVIGIHRRLNETALRQVFKNHTLDYLLFPESDVIANAPAVIDAVRNVFPARENYHVFGICGEIIWGGAVPIVTFRFGVIIEIGGDGKVAILGQARLALPKEDAPVVEINMDLIGIIDLGNETLAIDAVIYDSRILQFSLSGDMALRTSWGDDPDFALSIGGFNPRFSPPPGFPPMRRVIIEMRRGPASLVFSSYLAITSNTFQTGACLQIDMDLKVASISGGAGFDALIHFKPFEFIADFYAWLDVKVGPLNLANVDLLLTLSGPNQFRAVGYAKIDLLFSSVKIDVDATFGDKEDAELETVSPFDLLAVEMDDERNISVRIPEWSASSVALLDTVQNLKLLDPDGELIIQQNKVPICFKLERFAEGVPPANERYLDIDLDPGGAQASPGTIDPPPLTKRPFSPAKFRNLSDDEAISSPPFEDLPAGRAFVSGFDSSRHNHHTSGIYETIVDERDEPETTKAVAAPPSDDMLCASWRLQAGMIRHAARTRGRNPAHPKSISAGKPGFTLTTDQVVDGVFQRAMIDDATAGDMTYVEAVDLAKTLGNPDVVVRDSALSTELEVV